MKCKAHSQGDYCRREVGHADLVHQGQFTRWQENKFREEIFACEAPRRDRQLNRFLRGVDPAAVPARQRPGTIAILNQALKQLGGPA